MKRLPLPALLALALPALLVAACANDTAPPAHASARGSADVPYRLDRPDAVMELAPALREISALTVLPNGRLATLQDEDGIFYELDPTTGRILFQAEFGAGGDFEGIERLPDALWALKSNGDLYRVHTPTPDSMAVEVFETPLGGRNDTEGLAYDAARNRLLIACKEHPGNGLKGVRAIYAFDLTTETLSETPAYTLDRSLIDTDDETFKPSALAVRPDTREVYVLSSVRKALAVLGPDGALRAVVPLSPQLFAQPEGIAFAPDGTLYISNEGPHGPATLLRFSRQN